MGLVSAGTDIGALVGTEKIPVGGAAPSVTTPARIKTYVGAWLLASGGTLTGANVIVGSATNTIQWQFPSLATTPVNGAGLWLQNPTAAAAGAQQISPSVVWEGQGWKTNATAASQSIQFKSDVLPIQGAANPTGIWKLQYSINGAAYLDAAKIYDGGAILASRGGGVISSLGGLASNGYGATGANYYSDQSSVTAAKYAIGDWAAAIEYSAGGYLFKRSSSTGPVDTQITWITIASLDRFSNFTLTQQAQASGWSPAITSTPGAHTSLTSATEFISRDFAGANWTWAAGTIATQRFNYFRAFTVTTGLASDAYTVWMDPPTGNITRAWALGLNGNLDVRGSVKFNGTNSTGAGSAALGANSPATTLTAPYTWITAISADGSTVYIPCWK